MHTLYVNGVILEPDDATLADLQIEAEAIINVSLLFKLKQLIEAIIEQL